MKGKSANENRTDGYRGTDQPRRSPTEPLHRISAGALALWSVFRLIWTLYIGMTFGWFLGSMVFQFVLWGVIGTVAAVAAVGFLTRYTKSS